MKKVFFIVQSLAAGGAERVFWLLSQELDRSLYEVAIVLLTDEKLFFPKGLENVRIVNLGTQKATFSVFKLYNFLKRERPFAVFATGGTIIALVGFVSKFVRIPNIIARPSNVQEVVKYAGLKSKLWKAIVGNGFLKRFNVIVCQSEEIKTSLIKKCNLESKSMIVIPNPVIPARIKKETGIISEKKQLIIVARLTKQKGHERLLQIIKHLPEHYILTIAGDGPLREDIASKIKLLGLEHRVSMLGLVSDIPNLIAKHDLFVLPSYVEGFPNVVGEALSVGVPVVSFEVGGISQLIQNGFNGYVIQQNDIVEFTRNIIKACDKDWNHSVIRSEVINKFDIKKIASSYESLLN